MGESHGEALGYVIEGVPPNLSLNERYIQRDLDKRKPVNQNLLHKEKKMIK